MSEIDESMGADAPETTVPPASKVPALALKAPHDQQAAEKAFRARLKDKINFIVTECYPENLRNRLGDLAEIISAGKALGLTEGRRFERSIAHEPYLSLHPLLVLGMTKQARVRLVEFLAEQGVEETFLPK